MVAEKEGLLNVNANEADITSQTPKKQESWSEESGGGGSGRGKRSRKQRAKQSSQSKSSSSQADVNQVDQLVTEIDLTRTPTVPRTNGQDNQAVLSESKTSPGRSNSIGNHNSEAVSPASPATHPSPTFSTSISTPSKSNGEPLKVNTECCGRKHTADDSSGGSSFSAKKMKGRKCRKKGADEKSPPRSHPQEKSISPRHLATENGYHASARHTEGHSNNNPKQGALGAKPTVSVTADYQITKANIQSINRSWPSGAQSGIQGQLEDCSILGDQSINNQHGGGKDLTTRALAPFTSSWSVSGANESHPQVISTPSSAWLTNSWPSAPSNHHDRPSFATATTLDRNENQILVVNSGSNDGSVPWHGRGRGNARMFGIGVGALKQETSSRAPVSSDSIPAEGAIAGWSPFGTGALNSLLGGSLFSRNGDDNGSAPTRDSSGPAKHSFTSFTSYNHFPAGSVNPSTSTASMRQNAQYMGFKPNASHHSLPTSGVPEQPPSPAPPTPSEHSQQPQQQPALYYAHGSFQAAAYFTDEFSPLAHQVFFRPGSC